MLKQYHHFALLLLVLADAIAVGLAWLASYWIRFRWLPVDPGKAVPDLADKFLPLLPAVIVVHLIIFQWVRLYRPRRHEGLWGEVRDIAKAFFVAIVAVVLLDYAMPQSNKISRRFLLTYAVVGTTCIALFRLNVRMFLRALRRRGWNRRSAVIVGSGRTAQRLLQALRRNKWTGMDVHYFVDDRRPEQRDMIRGVPVRGPLANLREIIEADAIDSVFVALPTEQMQRLDEVFESLGTSMADVRFVPDISPTYAMRQTVHQLGELAVLSLRQTPLYGWNVVMKRAFDLVLGTAFTLLALVPMGLIALAIKLTSTGPVFYRQRRIGLDGEEFDLVKFRTMRLDAEADGPVWSRKSDSRRTPIGTFLRRTSLDELPNLFNVLAGQMSLVGPRPERPEFITEFKEQVPRYMLRHKMKAGMTGFAQIKGYRGDTSLKKRIQHDVHYIQHWSLGLDIRILLQTIFGVWFSRHEV